MSTFTFGGSSNQVDVKFANGTFGLNSKIYGDTLPTSGTEGQVFFQLSNDCYELPPGGYTGQALIKNSSADRDVEWGPAMASVVLNNAAKYYVTGSVSAVTNTNDQIFNTSIYVNENVLFGAAWNDYAEYRQSDITESGRCIVENGDDTMSISTERMQLGAEIISDTYGFAIGQTEIANAPVAIAGRVLAYPFEDIQEFKKSIGKPVCSGPNGTVSIMTDEEYKEKSYCSIGIISAVPSYEEWGQNNIKVNGRVWIRIR